MKTTHDEFAQLWPHFMHSEEARGRVCGQHIHRIARERNVQDIIDTGAGVGWDAKWLLQRGYAVDINEIDDYFRAVAEEQALRGYETTITSGDWRSLTAHVQKRYDLALCLGNSLTYLHNREDQEQALKEMRNILNTNGALLIDHRNYDAMLDDRSVLDRRLINREMYVGQGVTVLPTEITPNNIRLEYRCQGIRDHLDLHPFRFQEMQALLHEAGFREVRSYAHWQELGQETNPLHYDENTFFQHLAIK